MSPATTPNGFPTRRRKERERSNRRQVDIGGEGRDHRCRPNLERRARRHRQWRPRPRKEGRLCLNANGRHSFHHPDRVGATTFEAGRCTLPKDASPPTLRADVPFTPINTIQSFVVGAVGCRSSIACVLQAVAAGSDSEHQGCAPRGGI